MQQDIDTLARRTTRQCIGGTGRRRSCTVPLLVVALLTAAPNLAQAEGAGGAPPITERPWTEAVVSVGDLDRAAAFFTTIGGYRSQWRGPMKADELASFGLDADATGEAMLLGPPGADRGLVRLVAFANAGPVHLMRPGAHAWDTGCYFSLMVRMKDMAGIHRDAVAMGWDTETPITYLEFGTSRLNVMIFRGPYGLNVQGYERLSPPLPTAIPPFERMTRPFNVMQMVRDRDASYRYFTEVLGFATFFSGEPYVDDTPTPNPLGIPVNLTTSVRYRASIVYPVPGEFGRMEMIEIIDLDGYDHSDRCRAPNLGILSIRFEVDDVDDALALIVRRGGTVERPIERVTVAPYGPLDSFSVETPDGALIEFFERLEIDTAPGGSP